MRFIGYGEMWESQNIPLNDIDFGSIKHVLKLATVQRFDDECENDIKDTEKNILCCYIKFKANFGVEPYLDLVYVSKYTRAISQPRVSSHRTSD